MRVKAILQELIDEIRIDGRDTIEPTFLVPTVRPPSRSTGDPRLEPGPLPYQGLPSEWRIWLG